MVWVNKSYFGHRGVQIKGSETFNILLSLGKNDLPFLPWFRITLFYVSPVAKKSFIEFNLYKSDN